MTGQRFIATEPLELIGEVSSYCGPTGGDYGTVTARWTELRLFYRKGERRPFLAESWGCTSLPGERTFRRQRVAKTLHEALVHFDGGHLLDALVTHAQAWEDANPDKVAAPQTQARAPLLPAAADDCLKTTLARIYGPNTEGALSVACERDFGIPARTVRHSIAAQASGKDLPPWARAWLQVLRLVDVAALRQSFASEAQANAQ